MLSNILVVDDEYQIKQTFEDIFREEIAKGYYKFDFAANGQEALKKIHSGSIPSVDLLLTDVKMPKIDGLSLIKRLQKERLNIKTIIISAFVSLQDLQEIIENNDLILGFLSKPIENIEQLKNIVENNLNSPRDIEFTSHFNYDSLAPQDFNFIQQKTGEIKSLIRLSTQTIVEIGCKLIEVKTRLKHGQFGDWLKLEFDWSEPTAQRFMRVARKFKSVKLTDLPIVPSALYLLAANSIPEEARSEAIQRAATGESINYQKAKEIKDKYSSKESSDSNSKQVLQQASFTNQSTTDQDSQPLSWQTIDLIEPSSITITDNMDDENISLAIKPESWWRLGKEHFLYCGDPKSATFQESFPQNIDLSLVFPHNFNWRPEFSKKVNSELVFYSEYQDIDLTVLRQAIEQLFLLYTEDYSTVIFSFLPDPQLILLADKLKCICRIAEPNLQQCQKIITTLKQAGLDVVNLI